MDEKWLLEKIVPGVLGSTGAMLWMKGTWLRKMSMVVLGIATSYYVSPTLIQLLAADAGAAIFCVGLFGMTIIDWIFRLLESVGLEIIIRDWLRKFLGLPPKE